MDIRKVKDTLFSMKQNGTVIRIPNGFLKTIPFDFSDSEPECIELLSRWRIENPSLSPARFPISNERTERWLKNSILNNELRIMFMIQNEEMKNIGHIGLSGMNFETNSVRLDSVMKGVKDGTPGIMHHAIQALKDWCRNTLEANSMDLVVLDDNARAIKLYHSCNFHQDKVIFLRKEEKNGEINWVEDSSLTSSPVRFIHMVTALE